MTGRHEVKFFIDKLEAYRLKKELAHICKQDQNTNEKTSGYKVRSLYFDTLDNRCFQEKISGVLNRKKYRIRIYPDSFRFDEPQNQLIKLEIKKKYNNIIDKESSTIQRDIADKIIEGNIPPLLPDEKTLNKVICTFNSQHFIPTNIVEFERRAFVFDFSNVRITFDENLKHSEEIHEFFKRDIPFTQINDDRLCILEVKFDYVLPSFFSACYI